jgi:hypothetical protein
MTSKYLSVILIIALGAVFASPSKAQQFGSGTIGVNHGQAVALIAGAAAVVTVIAVVTIYEVTKKRAVTGCVNTSQNGMTVTDEKDKRTYALSGNTADIKPGDRMTLQGKRIKPTGNNPLTWETKKIAKDLGACHL